MRTHLRLSAYCLTVAALTSFVMRSVVTDDFRDCGHHLVSNHQQCAFDQLQRWQFLSICEALGGHRTNVVAVAWTTNRGKEKNS